MKILLILNRDINHKENCIIKNFKKHNIEIVVSSNINDYKNDDYKMIFSNIDYSKKKIKKYFTIIQVVKKIINKMPTIQHKLAILKDLFKGIDVIMFSAGPSSKEYDKHLIKKLQDSHLIITVKYVIDNLINDNIIPDIAYFSAFSENVDNSFSLTKCFNRYKDLNMITFGIYRIGQVNDKGLFDLNSCPIYSLSHEDVFQNLIKTKDFKILRFSKTQNDKILFHLAHCIFEVVIPFCEHLAVKNIYTYGWDGPEIDGSFNYCNTDKKFTLEGREQEHKGNVNGLVKGDINDHLEYKFVKIIASFLKEKNNLFLFKCSKNSPINLDYFDLETIKK